MDRFAPSWRNCAAASARMWYPQTFFYSSGKIDRPVWAKVLIERPHCNPRLDNRWSNVYHRGQIEGRMSSMEKQAQQRIGLLQGTPDMLILRPLLYGPAHGHQIGKHISEHDE